MCFQYPNVIYFVFEIRKVMYLAHPWLHVTINNHYYSFGRRPFRLRSRYNRAACYFYKDNLSYCSQEAVPQPEVRLSLPPLGINEGPENHGSLKSKQKKPKGKSKTTYSFFGCA